MPANSVTVTARFEHIASSDDDKLITTSYAPAGARVSIPLPPDVLSRGNVVVPFYTVNGVRRIAQNSAIINGNLVFTARVAGQSGYMVNEKTFSDISGHWPRSAIEFAAAREIFNGVDNGLFDPDGRMTRAMFVTVLSRLDGPISGSGAGAGTRFTDVKPGGYYEDAVRWAQANGIVNGFSEKESDPDGAPSPGSRWL